MAKKLDKLREDLIKYHKEYETDEEGLNYAEKAINSLAERSEINGIPAEGRNHHLGDRFHTIGNAITTKFIRDGGLDLIGARVSNPEELASIMQAYRNPLFETARVFYLRDEKIVSVEGISCQLPNLVIISFPDADSVPEHIRLSMQHYEADSFYLLHNHPSGDPTPSHYDQTLTRTVSQVKGFKGHIVINHKTFALMSNTGDYVFRKLTGNEKDIFLTPSLQHPLLGANISTPEAVAEIGKQLEVIDNTETSYLIYSSSGGTIRALQEISSDIFLMHEDFPTWVSEQMKQFGTVAAFCITSNPNSYHNLSNAVREGYLIDAVFLSDYGFYWSMRDDLQLKSYNTFSKREESALRYFERIDDSGKKEWIYDPNTAECRLYIDMDGTLAVFKPTEEIETLYEKDYFRKLPPQGNMIEGIKLFMKANPQTEVFILSSVLSDSPYALEEKQDWLDLYLPQIDRAHRIFPPCGVDKAEFIYGDIKPTDILLDDYTNNLLSWQKHGGTGIKAMNGINGTKGRWQDRQIDANGLPELIANRLATTVQRLEMQNQFMRESQSPDLSSHFRSFLANQKRKDPGNGPDHSFDNSDIKNERMK